jgi:hypothetical protein
MSAFSIDRFTLTVPFMSEVQGRRLATGIAGGLAATRLSWAGGEFPKLRIDVTANAGANPDYLADQVVAEIIRQIGRAS